MNIVPKEFRRLIGRAVHAGESELKTRADAMHIATTVMSASYRIMDKLQSKRGSKWEQIIQYDGFKIAQLADLKKKSNREFIRQAINYLCYMSKLMHDLDCETRGVLPDGMFNKKLQQIINTEALKALNHDGK